MQLNNEYPLTRPAMKPVIKDRQITTSTWQISTEISEIGQQLIPLDLFLDHRELLLGRREPIGIWLESDQEVESLENDLTFFSLIALNFPTFTDGRHYSTAMKLRRQYGYEGEIRAVGDVRIDQLEQLSRCGFNAFELADGQSVNRGIDALSTFTYTYQSSWQQSQPLFRFRAES